MKRRLILFFAISLLITGTTFEEKVLTLKGSDTMVILVQKWTEEYPDKSVQFQVTGGGSGTGIASLINGTTDICSSSRPMKSAEALQMKQKYGKPPIEIRINRRSHEEVDSMGTGKSGLLSGNQGSTSVTGLGFTGSGIVCCGASGVGIRLSMLMACELEGMVMLRVVSAISCAP